MELPSSSIRVLANLSVWGHEASPPSKFTAPKKEMAEGNTYLHFSCSLSLASGLNSSPMWKLNQMKHVFFCFLSQGHHQPFGKG